MLGFAIAFTIVFNVFLLQRRFRPLEELVDQMERADLSRPGANLRVGESPGGPEEVERLHHAFVRMLERLEAERRRASSVALDAQEEERARVARDLHDEVNQSLTGLLLRLEATREKAPPELADELAEIRTLANQAMQELLTLARQLRPTALDDLGLKAALAGPCRRARPPGRDRDQLRGRRRALGPATDVQVVVYRVAQEALSNAVRHSGAGECTSGSASTPAWSSSTSATTARDSPSTRPRAGSGWPACASARCSSTATCRSSRGRMSAQVFGSACR